MCLCVCVYVCVCRCPTESRKGWISSTPVPARCCVLLSSMLIFFCTPSYSSFHAAHWEDVLFCCCCLLLPFCWLFVAYFTVIPRPWRSPLLSSPTLYSLSVGTLALGLWRLRSSEESDISLNGLCVRLSISLHRVRTGERERHFHSLPHTKREEKKEVCGSIQQDCRQVCPWKGTGSGGGEGCWGKKGGKGHSDGAINNGRCLSLSLFLSLCVCMRNGEIQPCSCVRPSPFLSPPPREFYSPSRHMHVFLIVVRPRMKLCVPLEKGGKEGFAVAFFVLTPSSPFSLVLRSLFLFAPSVSRD